MRRLFIFDLHNTLVKDNDLTVTEAINSVLAERKKNTRVDVEYVRNYQARLRPFSQYFRDMLPSATQQEVEEMTLATKEKCERFLIRKHVKKMDHADKVLQEIKSRGDEVLVLSFSTAASIDIYLRIAGLEELIDRRLGIETRQEVLSDEDPGRVKAGLLEEHLGAEKSKYDSMFMIGDSASDMKAGRAVGATNIYFTKTKEILDIADHRIDDLRDVLRIAYGSM